MSGMISGRMVLKAPSFRDVNHVIDTGSTDPVFEAMYRLSLKEKAEV